MPSGMRCMQMPSLARTPHHRPFLPLAPPPPQRFAAPASGGAAAGRARQAAGAGAGAPGQVAPLILPFLQHPLGLSSPYRT